MVVAWRIEAWLGVTRSSRVGRGRRGDDTLPRLWLVARGIDEAAFRRGYALLRELGPVGVVHPHALVSTPDGLAMALDGAAVPLAGRMGASPGEWRQVLASVRGAVQALAALHACGQVHRDLRPANFLVDEATGQLWLADVARAAPPGPCEPLDGDGPEPGGPSRADAADPWAYLAPEQTAAADRPVDARADLYALGVLLYRLLAGRLPFDATDPMEWVHCHVARSPEPLRRWSPELPAVVEAIVARLLAKAPEDRYQSAQGLLADIDRCLQAADAQGRLTPFAVGAADLPPRLDGPVWRVGREPEISALGDALDAVAGTGRSRCVLLSGAPGAGKSVVAQSLRERVLALGGRYAEGKYDLAQADVPYSALMRALDGLVHQLLAGSEPEVRTWRLRIGEALGPNASVAVALVPALGVLLGPTPAVPVLEAAESQRRLQLVVRQLMGALVLSCPPLVLLLDDLHAADPGSLALLDEALADPLLGPLLVVGTCPTVDGVLPPALQDLLDRWQASQVPALHLAIAPWTRAQLSTAVSMVLGAPVEDLAGLCEAVQRKTAGNPLFTVEFLRDLQAAALLKWDAAAGCWRWDVRAVDGRGLAGNVVELLVRRLQRLPDDTRAMLRQAACLGTLITTPLLAALSGVPVARVGELLAPAVEAALIGPVNGSVAFVHDRVREAAYELIPAAERPGVHLQIGRLLLQRLTAGEREERLFDIVHQLRHGAHLLQGDEAVMAWSLCARAGRKARDSSAFASARTYFRLARLLQPAGAWADRHDEAVELALMLAECESLAGEPDEGERLLDEALAHARHDPERVQVQRTRVRLRTACSRYAPALACALDTLQLMGMPFPADDAALPPQIDAERHAVQRALAGRRPAELLELPAAQASDDQCTLALLVDAFFPARNSRPALFPLLVLRAVRHSLEHGHTVHSCQAYALYPRLLRGEGRLQEAYAFSSLSLQLADRLGARAMRGSLLFSHLASSFFLAQPYASGLSLLHEGFEASLQAGTLYDAAGCALVAVEYLLECGDSLDEIVKAAQTYAPSLRAEQAGLWPMLLRSWVQFALAVQGRTASPTHFDGEGFSEVEYLAAVDRWQSVALRAIHAVLKQVAACLAGDHLQSLDWAAQAARLLEPLAGMAIEVTHRHHRMLSLAALLPRGAPPQDERLALLRQDAAALEVLAQACPLNFGHRLCLVQAELARVEGDDAAAARLYAQAVESAHRHGFALHEAQAMERAAAFHLERGDRRLAMALFKEARDGYRQWGAAIKARALEATHPALVAGWGAGPAGLDALAVAKATQALSSRIELEGLIDALMRIALDHAGAQAAWLFLDEGGAVRPAAAATVDGTQVQVQVGPGDAGWPDLLPMAVVQYVRRTREPVLIADAERPHPFLADAYMRQARPRSVMGLPLLRRGVVVGVLYLEHRLSPHAFTRGRVALLEMLAAQAAISLETARLYAALKQENAERERAQQAATERQSRLQRLVESNLVGVPFADLDGRIVDANEAFLQMVGYHRADLAAGRLNWAEMTPPAYREADQRAAEALRREGRVAPYEKVLRRKDGTEVPVLVGGILFEGEQPQTVGFVLDLTERRRAESERAARVAAEAASEAKSSFLASMSHELRTPLNGVLGYAQLLQMDPGLTPKQRQGLAAIETSGRHLLSLINDILDLARIEAGRLSLVLEPVHLRRVVDTVADTVRPLAERRHLAFRLEAQADLDLTVQADERRLSQVLLNLLGNAVKFTDQGGVTLRVQQTASGPSEARVVFEVQDTGVGMGEDELQRIFRPFEQVGAAHRRVEGTGLGLAITDALVRQMAGTLAVRSRPGDGTVFRVELRLPVLAQAASRGPPGGVTGYEGPRRTVLVVDDVADSRQLLVELLRTLGFEPMEACDGPQALAIARARRPDLVLMDNGMPGMTGLEVTQALRADARLADVPVITVSAGASEADRQRCLAAGVSAFVPKPVDVDDLLQAIGRVLQLRWTTCDDEPPPGPA